MSTIEEEHIKAAINAAVGRWALGIIVTVAAMGFFAGKWASNVDSQLAALTRKVESIQDAQAQAQLDLQSRREEWARWRYAVQSQADTNTAYLAQIEGRFQPVERQYWKNR